MLVDAAHNPGGLARMLPRFVTKSNNIQTGRLFLDVHHNTICQAFSQLIVSATHILHNTIVLTKPLHGRYPGVPIDALQELGWPSESERHACEDAEASYRFLTEQRPHSHSSSVRSILLVKCTKQWDCGVQNTWNCSCKDSKG